MNKIKYIIFSPGDNELLIGFNTALDAESFLASQSSNVEWQAQWTIERLFAYNEFHYAVRTNQHVILNFNVIK